jgi:hypothetical protein
MNHEADNGLLLNDVLAEAAAPDFRGAMLDQMLGLARRRRRWRQTRRVAGIVAVLGLLGILVWQKNLPHRASAPVTVAKVVEKSCTLVRTQPLSAGELVTTQPLAPEQFITSVATVKIVQSGKPDYRVIDDDQLLALFTFHPAALVRVGPHAVQLVFVNPADEKGFPVN